MTRPLADPTYLARAFLEVGVLAWPNDVELSPASPDRRLDASGALVRAEAAYR
ncbi:hypothetical protein KZ813_12115 [Sphingomonas sp. RHCKR7]|uniref:hypothetical protein n=1 Tax=Sphingomonas folli TaxID=2862497 RepID=UPI001CA55B3D|nr:hypothetical protein [Sphingomonas folli]MBW6527587.1 hypothetical protein [Sphingomonas folli]